jgi:hypothetical protein
MERDISYSDLCALLHQNVPFDGHIRDSSQRFFYHMGAVHHRGSADRVGEPGSIEFILSDFLQSRKYHKTLMEDFNADQQGASEKSLGGKTSQHPVCATAPADADTAPSCISPVHKGISLNEIDIDQNTALTGGEQEDSCTSMMNFDSIESDWQYTLALKEKGDRELIRPNYAARQKGYPPLWVVTVAYNGITEAGQAKSKKEAKHLASKKAWYRLGGKDQCDSVGGLD